jgi:hypothetical protein
MLSTTGLLVLVAIFAFASLLIALPQVLGRREPRGGTENPGEPDPPDGDATC